VITSKKGAIILRPGRCLKLALPLFGLSVIGCATCGNSLGPLAPLQISTAATAHDKPSAVLSVSWVIQPSPGRQYLRKMPAWEAMALNVLQESDLFSSVTGTNNTERGDVGLDLCMVNHIGEDTLLEKVFSGRLCGFTLTLIPFYVREDYRLVAIVRDSHGRRLKEYRYEDHVNLWAGLITLPMLPFMSLQKAVTRTHGNMLRHLVRDVSKEGILSSRRNSESQ